MTNPTLTAAALDALDALTIRNARRYVYAVPFGTDERRRRYRTVERGIYRRYGACFPR